MAGAPFLIADVCLLFVPLWATHWLGVLGTTVIATGTLAVVLAVLAYLAQTQRPLPLFRMIRLNVTPVITLVAAIGPSARSPTPVRCCIGSAGRLPAAPTGPASA